MALRRLLHEAAAGAAAEHVHVADAPHRHGTLEGHVLPGAMFVFWGACGRGAASHAAF